MKQKPDPTLKHLSDPTLTTEIETQIGSGSFSKDQLDAAMMAYKNGMLSLDSMQEFLAKSGHGYSFDEAIFGKKVSKEQFKHGSASKKYLLNPNTGKVEEVKEKPNTVIPIMQPPSQDKKASKSKAKSKENSAEFAAEQLNRMGYDLEVKEVQDPWIIGLHTYKVLLTPRHNGLVPLNKIVKIEVSSEEALEELIAETNNKAIIELYHLAKAKLVDGTIFKEQVKQSKEDLWEEMNATTLKVIKPIVDEYFKGSSYSPFYNYLESKSKLEAEKPSSSIHLSEIGEW